MPRPVCSTCSREMQMTRMGVLIVYCAVVTDQGPYEVWSGDEFGCPICKTKVVTAFAAAPSWRCHEGPLSLDVSEGVFVYERDPYFVRTSGGQWVFWYADGESSDLFDTYLEAKAARKQYIEASHTI